MGIQYPNLSLHTMNTVWLSASVLKFKNSLRILYKVFRWNWLVDSQAIRNAKDDNLI